VLQFYGYKKIFAEGLMGYGSTISVLVFLITLVISIFYIKVVGTKLFQEKG
jgi:multiple sugar transport system permease protein